ncbi:MAG: response regulator, partial [Flavobacteriales bacterium]|nr:response regulator [Flavobacteriales bacterium]
LSNILFLDFHLPDLNGDEVLHRLLGDKRTSDIPVYMLSADAMQKQIKRLKGLGVVDYLTKPLDIDLFLAILDEKLAKKNIG